LLATATPGQFVERLSVTTQTKSAWSAEQVADLKRRFSMDRPADPPEPVVDGTGAGSFFTALRVALPRDAILVTDSGLHQVLARRYFPVLAPGGLIFPSDFQSMGFGLPAAIGAKLAAPDRPVVVVLGDGGFLMSGLELATAVRDSVPVVVIVFNDGQLNLIRMQQLREFGRPHGVELRVPDLGQLAESFGARYLASAGDISSRIREAISDAQPTLIEVVVGDSPTISRVRTRSLARGAVRRVLGRRLLGWLKGRLR
jgi:acetolactate synthase-1/2/3 large subunit